jgi:hypothetical protein
MLSLWIEVLSTFVCWTLFHVVVKVVGQGRNVSKVDRRPLRSRSSGRALVFYHCTTRPGAQKSWAGIVGFYPITGRFFRLSPPRPSRASHCARMSPKWWYIDVWMVRRLGSERGRSCWLLPPVSPDRQRQSVHRFWRLLSEPFERWGRVRTGIHALLKLIKWGWVLLSSHPIHTITQAGGCIWYRSDDERMNSGWVRSEVWKSKDHVGEGEGDEVLVFTC